MEPWEKAEVKKEMWDTVLLWSCYDYYRSMEEIAEELKIPMGTLKSRLQRFRKKYPDAYYEILADRTAIANFSERAQHTVEKPDQLRKEMLTHVKEYF